MDALRAQVAQASALLDGARAALAVVDEQLARMTVRAPLSGEVLTCVVHPGELASVGTPLFTLADLDHLTLVVYVPEPDLGSVSLGAEVAIGVDAYTDRFAGRVARIASKAEFSPNNLESRQERVNKVFAVEIAIDNASGRLLPGMPADVYF